MYVYAVSPFGISPTDDHNNPTSIIAIFDFDLALLLAHFAPLCFMQAIPRDFDIIILLAASALSIYFLTTDYWHLAIFPIIWSVNFALNRE
jgi:hypothetical protein